MLWKVILKGVGGDGKRGKKKGGIKVERKMDGNEGVGCEMKLRCGRRNESLMVKGGNYKEGEMIGVERG